MSGAGELSGAGCAGCKTAYQIIDDFHKLSAERNNLKKFRQNLTGLADAIINGSFAHPNFLTAFNAPVCDWQNAKNSIRHSAILHKKLG